MDEVINDFLSQYRHLQQPLTPMTVAIFSMEPTPEYVWILVSGLVLLQSVYVEHIVVHQPLIKTLSDTTGERNNYIIANRLELVSIVKA